MILAIDIGNTNIVFGVGNQDEWLNIWRIQTDPLKTADEYEVIFRSLLSVSNIDVSRITKTIVSSVVPKLVNAFGEMLYRLVGQHPVMLDSTIYSKLPIQVLNPLEIGSDLVADATAAFMRYKLPCVVIDFGTAITFTTISQSGEILGVAIAPGLQTALKSLTQNTAQLFDVQLINPHSVLGKNTRHAIQAGIVLGYAGMVDSMVSNIEQELGEKPTVVATGGLANVLQNVSTKIEILNENLTLDGLKYISGLI
jgi:type III pantothenate kinase